MPQPLQPCPFPGLHTTGPASSLGAAKGPAYTGKTMTLNTKLICPGAFLCLIPPIAFENISFEPESQSAPAGLTGREFPAIAALPILSTQRLPPLCPGCLILSAPIRGITLLVALFSSVKLR